MCIKSSGVTDHLLSNEDIHLFNVQAVPCLDRLSMHFQRSGLTSANWVNLPLVRQTSS